MFHEFWPSSWSGIATCLLDGWIDEPGGTIRDNADNQGRRALNDLCEIVALFAQLIVSAIAFGELVFQLSDALV